MAGPTKNLCAQIPVELHNRLRAEQERSGLTLSAYMTDLLAKYYEKGGEKTVEGMRTMAFQMPEEMFQRLKKHLERESQRIGKKVSQKQFMLDLIRRVLYEAEQTEAADQMGVLQAQ
ncbi:MAG: 4-oxalocrotonate tautomerase [Oscillospiraceae bacterium]|nr:4-oxalocrotonate tautomerase [Oscillospiraceae bacterium]